MRNVFRFACPLRFRLFVRSFILGLGNCTVSPSDLLWWLFFQHGLNCAISFRCYFRLVCLFGLPVFLSFRIVHRVCPYASLEYFSHSLWHSILWLAFLWTFNQQQQQHHRSNTTRVNNTLHLALWTLLALAMKSTCDLFSNLSFWANSFFLLFNVLSCDGSTGLGQQTAMKREIKKTHQSTKNFLRMFIIIFARLCICILWFLAWCTLYSFTRAHHTSHTHMWSEYWTWSKVIGCCQHIVVGFILHSSAWNVLKSK